jgi:DNA-binding NarL/FixJ family response regulator
MNSPTTPIRLLLVDDHAVVRAGLNAILGADPRLAIVGAVATVAEVLPAVVAYRPAVVLLDVRLPDGSGTTLVRSLKALPEAPRVAMLTSFAEPVEVFAALEAGVDGYLLKDSDADALVAALVAIAAGQQVLHPQIRPLVLGGPPANVAGGRLASLSAAERRVLALVTEGRTNKEIADAVGLAEKTVRNQMTVILSKLGVERRAQAVALFVEEQAKGR